MTYLYRRMIPSLEPLPPVPVADVVAPTAAFLPIVPDVGGNQVSIAYVTFSEPVTGVTAGDFTLTRNAGGNLLLGSETVTQVNATTWYIADLESYTNADGTFLLTLVAAGSGITDASANALASNATVSWTWDRTVPTADVTNIAPDPRSTAVDEVTVVFSEYIVNMNRNNVTLTKDAGANLITAANTCTTSDHITWTINGLAGLTAGTGTYVLTVNTAADPNKITDLNLNELAVSASDTWIVSGASLGVSITPVTTPRSTALSSATIVFSAAVTGFAIGDLTLTRDGGANLLTGSQTLTSGDNITWTLGNLSGITGTDGTYTLTLTASGSGIIDGSSNPLSNDSHIDWAKDAVAPTAAFTAVSPDPITTPISSLTVTFSEAVTGVTIGDFSLTRNGGSNLLTGSNTVTTSNNITYQITGLAGITALAGFYTCTLTASGSGITDAAANAFAVNATESWTANTGTPTATVHEVDNDPRNTAVASILVEFSEDVTGVSITDFTLTRDGGGNIITGSQTVSGSGSLYTVGNLSGLTGTNGTYLFTLVASGSGITDVYGNALTANATETWEKVAGATVTITAVSPDPRSTPVDEIEIVFSEAVQSFDKDNLTLTRNAGPNLITVDHDFSTSDFATYTLGALSDVTANVGDYLLTLDPTGVTTLADGLTVDTGDTEAWELANTAWPGVSAGGSFQVLGSYHQNLISGIGPIPRTVTNTSWSGGVLTVTTNIVHLLYTRMWVEIEGVTPTAINGTYEVQTVPSSTTFTVNLVGNPGAHSVNGTMTLLVPKRLSMMPHFSIVAKEARGTELGYAGYPANHYVSYGLTSGLKQIASSEGSVTAISGLIKITSTSHGFSTGDVVEISGHFIQGTAEQHFAQGVWVITVIDPDTFTLDGSTWPETEVSYAATGIVELHSNAVAQRAALLSGGTDNPADTTIDLWSETTGVYRSYKQAADQYKDWLESKVDWSPGYYFSTSNIGTPYQVSERGSQGSYPFPLVEISTDYTNGWGITSSQRSTVAADLVGSKLLELTMSKTMPTWTNTSGIRAVILNHSNPSYGIDQFLDDAGAFDLLKGITGTSTAGTTTVLTDSTATFDYRVLGRPLHITGGALGGQSRVVVNFTATTLTVGAAFTGSIGAGITYLCGTLGHKVHSSSGNTLTLRTPYRGDSFGTGNGTGGCVLFYGPLAGGNSITNSGVSDGASGTYITLNTADSHGLAVDDYVLVSNTSLGAYNYRIASAYQQDPIHTRVTVRKVVSVPSASSVVLDQTYQGTATGGWWFGTCLSLAPEGYSLSTRIDQPDYRRSDVRALFNGDLIDHIDTVFARDGIRHIGLFDETSFRHASSASPMPLPQAIHGSLCGETTDEMIERIGEIGTHVMENYGVMINPNCTGWVTQDTLSASQRQAIIDTWGGFTSEIACMLWDRSTYQMKDGWLTHIEDLVSNGCVYYYQPQTRVVSSVNLENDPTNSTSSNGGRLRIQLASDAGFYPTANETTYGSHNHSGHIIGIYGNSSSDVNGVHRVRGVEVEAITGDYLATLETRWVSDGTGGTAVYSNCFAPHKTLRLYDSTTVVTGGTLWRVETEFPHGIPLLAEGDTWIKLYGYGSSGAAIPDGTLLKVSTQSATTFDIISDSAGVATTYKRTGTDDNTDGIVFHTGNGSTTVGADEEHWYGISYMLWEEGYPLWFNRSALNRHITHDVTHENVHGWLPDTLVPDGAYTQVTHAGTATSTDGTNPKLDINASGSAFTNAVLGEQLLFTSGLNSGEWRKIVQVMSSTKIKVDANFTNNVSNGNTFVIGQTHASDPQKVLELKRTFDGATKTVQVFPQKSYVTYTGFTWDTDA